MQGIHVVRERHDSWISLLRRLSAKSEASKQPDILLFHCPPDYESEVAEDMLGHWRRTFHFERATQPVLTYEAAGIASFAYSLGQVLESAQGINLPIQHILCASEQDWTRYCHFTVTNERAMFSSQTTVPDHGQQIHVVSSDIDPTSWLAEHSSELQGHSQLYVSHGREVRAKGENLARKLRDVGFNVAVHENFSASFDIGHALTRTYLPAVVVVPTDYFRKLHEKSDRQVDTDYLRW